MVLIAGIGSGGGTNMDVPSYGFSITFAVHLVASLISKRPYIAVAIAAVLLGVLLLKPIPPPPFPPTPSVPATWSSK